MDAPGWHFMQEGVVLGMFNHQGGLAEGTRHFGTNSVYGRFETHQVETDVLTGAIQHAQQVNTLLAFTLGGGVRDLMRSRGFEVGIGGALTVYGVPGEMNHQMN